MRNKVHLKSIIGGVAIVTLFALTLFSPRGEREDSTHPLVKPVMATQPDTVKHGLMEQVYPTTMLCEGYSYHVTVKYFTSSDKTTYVTEFYEFQDYSLSDAYAAASSFQNDIRSVYGDMAEVTIDDMYSRTFISTEVKNTTCIPAERGDCETSQGSCPIKAT
jgi:hypothetical protein